MELYPGLRESTFRLTSPATSGYNCLAWAAEDDARWWSADEFPLYYWPNGVPRENTVEGWAAALASVGYEQCDDDTHQPGYTRVAIYGRGGAASHVARQLPTGRWTSKMGKNVDIEHDLEALTGVAFGEVVMLMHRPAAAPPDSPQP
jgi:hypothetical protein